MQAATPHNPLDKAAWRKWFRAQLRTLTPAEVDAQSAAIRQQICTFLYERPPLRIASFAALPGEPRLLPLLDQLPQHCWLLPRVGGETLAFHPVDSSSPLETSAYGIAEPRANSPDISPEAIDLFLCPGLGFDRHGTRLGHGKGFYDRSLAIARPQTPRLGILFHQQLVDQLPSACHDLPMTQLIFPET